MKIREQDIVLIYHACFIVHQGLRARYNYYTLIPLFYLIIALKNEVCHTFIPHVLSYNGFGFNMVFVSWVKIS